MTVKCQTLGLPLSPALMQMYMEASVHLFWITNNPTYNTAPVWDIGFGIDSHRRMLPTEIPLAPSKICPILETYPVLKTKHSLSPSPFHTLCNIIWVSMENLVSGKRHPKLHEMNSLHLSCEKFLDPTNAVSYSNCPTGSCLLAY